MHELFSSLLCASLSSPFSQLVASARMTFDKLLESSHKELSYIDQETTRYHDLAVQVMNQPRQRLLLTDFSYSRGAREVDEGFAASTLGMGNQMFQLAALQEVARKHQATVVLPNSFLLRRAFRFDNILFVDESSYNNIFREYHEKIIKQKSCCSYEELNLFEADDIQLIEGYFQNFRYFHPHSMLTTKEQFQWLDGVSEMASAFLENVDIQLVLKDAKRIGGEETDQVLEVADQSSRIVVGIHVRHGFDVVFNQRNAQHGHVVAPASYYDHAISKIIAEYRDVVFIVCSDNIAWARKNFNFGKDVPHFWCPGPREVDMAILSLCDELILSTGTFSWWSAYLNKNSNKRVFYYSEWPTPGSMMHKMINKSEFFLPEWTPLV